MKQSNPYSKEEKFRELIKEAYRKVFITEKQKTALLAKYNRKYDGDALSMQDRNALRMLRKTIIQYRTSVSESAIAALKFESVLELLSLVDKSSGIYCHVCKVGILVSRTVSSWIVGKDYELILEQKPAKVCSNNTCKSTSFSLAVEKYEDELINEVEKQLRSIRITNTEKLDQKKCPQCRSETLEANHTGDVYKYHQGLYHIKIRDVPLKAYCNICHYQEVGENIIIELEKLETLLDTETLELLKLDG